MKQPIPAAILKQHVAILGKTGSGKTSTAKLAVEQVVAEGARVCILDPIKSDWWGLTSSASGKKAGLPFRILGGPRGHVPLHSSAGKAIGELVAKGKLRLSILDMADFEPGGAQKFFVDFAQALFKHAKGVVYLVLEEAHEFAPKERAGFGAENMAIHWAKKLATGSRSKGIRLIVSSQRAQSLHNALLGSCDTLIMHRLTLPADQAPAKDWLKGNVSKEVFANVESSMSQLETGSAWICSGEAKIFEQVKFPRISTYDNSATPDGDTDHEVKTAPVDPDELKSIIGDAVAEAEANDPKALKAEIAKLKAAAAKAPAKEKIVEKLVADPKAEQIAYGQGWESAYPVAYKAGAKFAWAYAEQQLNNCSISLVENAIKIAIPKPTGFKPSKKSGPQTPPSVNTTMKQQPAIRAVAVSTPAAGDGSLKGPEQKIIASMNFWLTIGEARPTREQVAAVAGMSVRSSHYANTISKLKTAGHIDYPAGGMLTLTESGKALEGSLDMDDATKMVSSILKGPQVQIIAKLPRDGSPIARGDLAEQAGFSASSSHYANTISSLKTLDILSYPSSGQVAMTAWAAQVL